MPGINLALDDATELLHFIDSWLTTDHHQLNPFLHRYVGHPSYHVNQLKTTLARFIFLLGGDTEDDLLQPPTNP
jgi:hypothetical protein